MTEKNQKLAQEAESGTQFFLYFFFLQQINFFFGQYVRKGKAITITS